ncbi:MAG: hypothetical protein Q8N77_05510, partial [Nanoarchaeota archaeon]|nr:hypothetical protein [Nanoarchaeota archaeon]
MRLTKEITEELVKEVAGEDTVKLVGLLKDKENVSEFKLAEKLRLTVNTIRNMLYRLQAHNLVTSIRKKDKKKGWYIYYWTFNMPQAKSMVRIVKQKKLTLLKERLNLETQETFYICPQNCVRFKMEHAMDYDFKCPECGVVLQEEDNKGFIEKLNASIANLETEIAKPELEIRIRKPIPRLTKRIKLKALKKPKLKRKLIKPRKIKRLIKIRRPKLRKIKVKIKRLR